MIVIDMIGINVTASTEMSKTTSINGAEIVIVTEIDMTDATSSITARSADITVITARITECTILTSAAAITTAQTVEGEFGTARTQGFTIRISA